MKAEKRRIVIGIDPVGSHAVDALVFGDWAAHRSHRGPWYEVTHVRTGANIDGVAADLTKAQALKIARALGERAPAVRNGFGNVSLPRDTSHIWTAIIAEALS